MELSEGLKKARDLILSVTSEDDAKEQIQKIENLPDDAKKSELNKLYETAPDEASQGNVKGISIMLRVFEHFGDYSHDRMLLHYIAQAEANNALKNMGTETPQQIADALKLISVAFADANEINEENKIS